MKRVLKLELNSRLIVITGGKRGLGKVIADQFIKYGATVIVTSRSADFNSSRQLNNNTIFVQQLDVTSEASVKRFCTWVELLDQRICAFINNAGVGIFKSFKDITIDDWNLMIDTNLTGAFLCTKYIYEYMNKMGGGRIINMGSIAEGVPLLDNVGYGVSKAGLKFLSSMINEESKYEKIRVTHLTLGAVYTDIWDNRPGFDKRDMLDPLVVAENIINIVSLPLEVRVDSIEILPEKGIL